MIQQSISVKGGALEPGAPLSLFVFCLRGGSLKEPESIRPDLSGSAEVDECCGVLQKAFGSC